jgi:HAD superfamily hydrolase (TIGR01509 family)
MDASKPAFPQRPYQALIFDCDGTLTDSMPLHYMAWSHTMSEYGIAFQEDRFYALGGMPSRQIVQLLAAEHGVSIDDHQAAIDKEAMFMSLMHQLMPIREVLEVVEHFRGKLPMAVASGGYRDIILKQLQQIGCRDHFLAVVTAEDTARHKPEPDVFLLAAKRLGVDPSACLVYEDSGLGIQAAQAAGMDWIDVRTFTRSGPRRF